MAAQGTTTSSNPFAVRDFRLLWIGEAVSTLGDQFAMIALPWLALVLTGSAFALGGVLALMAVPRALLMLVGGVSVDRYSPRLVMLWSNAVRFVAVGALGVVVLSGVAELWMLYAFALLFGVADAFFYPAHTSIVPELVAPEQLQRAVGVVQGTAQASVLLGPAVAGVVIAALGGDASGTGATPATKMGIAIALLLDAGSFLLSLATLWRISPREHVAAPSGSLLESIREGVRFVWGKPGLRAMIGLSLAINLFISGPIEVGLPFIAYSRLPEGAAAFGLIMAAFGGGSLAGLAVGSALGLPRPSRLGPTIVVIIAVAGLGVAGLAFARSLPVAAVLGAVSGLAIGYTNLLAITFLQRRVPQELMGRVMGLMITGSVGLVPVSQLVAGVAVQLSVDATMIVAGVGMALLCVLSLLSPSVRNLGLDDGPAPVAAAPEALRAA